MSSKVFLFFLLLLVSMPGSARAAQPSGLMVTTAAQTVAPDTVSEQITVQAQGTDGAALAGGLPQTGCLALTSTSGSGQFSSSATNWNPVSVLTMNKSTANKNFFYKDSIAGSYTITIKLALKPEDESSSCASWPTEQWDIQWVASQSLVVGSGAVISASEATTSPSQSQTQTQSQLTVQNGMGPPTITVRMVSDVRVSAGAGSFFEADAYGSKGEPLGAGVRYLWNFGDGVAAEGRSVFHTYAYPGTYVVALTAAYNYSSALIRTDVRVVSADVSLVSEADGSLLLSNHSAEELAVGGWSLRRGQAMFVILEDTFVLAEGGIRFAPAVLGFVGGSDAGLFYPNGQQASAAVISASSPLRGEQVSAAQLKSTVATPAPVVHRVVPALVPEVSLQPAAVAASIEEAVPEGSRTALWLSLTALTGLLAAGAAGVRYLQPVGRPETPPRAEEFEIE